MVAASIGIAVSMVIGGVTFAFAADRMASAVAAGISSGSSGSGGNPSVLLSPPLPIVLSAPNATSGALFGFSVSAGGNLLAVGAPGLGEAFVVNTLTGSTLTLKDPETVGGALFGWSVSLGPGGGVLAVGAPGDSVGTLTEAGHVYVFNPVSGALLDTFTSPNAQTDGAFGSSVATQNPTVVVGAPSENSSGVQGAGNAYVGSLSTGFIGTLSDPAPTFQGRFGYSVAISNSMIVVGAPNQTFDSTPSAGMAYEFDAVTGHIVRALGSPYPESPTNLGDVGNFGFSVAISGGLIVVGAPYDQGPGDVDPVESGEAYVFNTALGGSVTTLTSESPQLHGYFGLSVAVSGPTAVVGAPEETSQGVAYAGNAYSFNFGLGDSMLSSFSSTNPQVSGLFGWSVAVTGNGATVVSGAWGEGGSAATDSGHAYVFRDPEVTLSGLTSGVGEGSQQFGTSVAVSGQTIVVGAPGWDVAEGAVWVFNQTLGYSFKLTSPAPADGNAFGLSVAIGDGMVVVGQPYSASTSPAYSDSGSVYVFSALTGALLYSLANPFPANYGGFGTAVAINGSYIVVGAPGDGISATGYVCVYNILSTTVLLKDCYYQSAATANAGFGRAIALSGTEAVVGAPEQGAGEPGAAYLFNVTTGATVQLSLPYSTGNYGGFGSAVAIDGSEALVGDPFGFGYDLAAGGAAYLFSVPSGSLLGYYFSPNGVNYGEFGNSVAISGISAVVGAPDEASLNGNIADAGNVYVFNTQTGQAADALSSPNAMMSGNFGWSLAFGGSSLYIGADYETAFGGIFSGHVYVV
jgi:hypothetical protein